MTTPLKVLRAVKGWDQPALASRIDVDSRTVSKWEAGTALPNSANLAACRAAFGEELWNWALMQVPEMKTRERGRPKV